MRRVSAGSGAPDLVPDERMRPPAMERGPDARIEDSVPARRDRLWRAGPAWVVLVVCAACMAPDDSSEEARRLTGGDPVEGRALVKRLGCVACHTMDGVPGARGLVGPPLDGLRERGTIAGVLTNEPENLVRWLQDPKALDHLSIMPDVGLTEPEARDVASFLYTLPP